MKHTATGEVLLSGDRGLRLSVERTAELLRVLDDMAVEVQHLTARIAAAAHEDRRTRAPWWRTRRDITSTN